MRRLSIPSFLDCSRSYRSMLGPTCKEIWRLLSPWPSVWRYIRVETGPRRQPKDPKSSKIRKREMWRKSRGACLGGPSRWSKSLKNSSQRRSRVARAQVERRPRGEDEGKCSATSVGATTSCEIASGRQLKKNFIPPWEKISLAPFAHTDGSPGWNP